MKRASVAPLAGTVLALIVVLAVNVSPARAQVAKIATVVRVVQHSTEGSNTWSSSKVGTALDDGDRVRTGQRSQAEVRFSDQSIVRLAQLSDLVVKAGKDLNLRKGKLFGDFKSPGKIKSGSTVANVKGSTFTVTRLADGTVEVILYDGGLEIITPQGRRQVNVEKGGTPQKITIAPPRAAQEGEEGGTGTGGEGGFMVEDLPADQRIDPEVQMPPEGTTLYVTPSSDTQIFIKNDQITTNDIASSGDEQDAEDIIQQIENPTIVVIGPPGPPGGGNDTGDIGVVVHSHNTRPHTTTALAQLTQGLNHTGSPAFASRLHGLRSALLSQSRGRAVPRQNTSSAAATQPASTGTASSEGSPAGTGTPTYFAPHFDGDLSAFIFEGGTSLAGRFHVNGMASGYYWDVAVAPTTLFESGTEADLTDAFVVVRTEEGGSLILGRQRFLKGPVQNTIFGTLMRQFGRDIQDAVTYSSPPFMEKRMNLDVAYLVDAYPSGLPTSAAGRQHGWYARLEYQSKKLGNYGLNLTNNNFSPTTGMTVDFGIPVLPNVLDLYGEMGQDTFNGKIRTLGLYFGGLFQKYGLDVFIEKAWLDRTISGAFIPSETLLRIYRKFGEKYSTVLTVDKKSAGDVNFGFGIVTKLPSF